ncbi:Uncharacterised protein [Mycobacterium tuberculosis]|nr:Uncharacterised protein [Mycobacterium tuberculosis]
MNLLRDGINIIFMNFKYQFIVYLHDHTYTRLLSL